MFLAQVATGVRARETAARVSTRAAESRLLGEQLNRLFVQMDHARADARKIQLALLPRQFPEAGGVRFAACHQPRGRSGADFYQVSSAGEGKLILIVGDVIGPGPAGGLLGRFVAHTAIEAAKHLPHAGAILNRVNRELLRLELTETPLVALVVALLNNATGELSLARAGMPAPVFVPAIGEPREPREPKLLAVPGPFLGITETTYLTHTARLSAGDRLLVGTDGTRPDGDPGPSDDAILLAAATRHREFAGQRFVDAIAAELLVHVRHDDDFTLLCTTFAPN